jgi:hypothetical protein
LGNISLGRPEDGMSMDDLMDLVARLAKEVEHLANGRIDSTNIREISDFNVSPTVFKHKSGIVGLNGGDPTNGSAIRFWAGSADPATAPFRVQQNGKMFAVGGQFSTSNTFPRIDFNDSNDSLLRASLDATHYIYITPDIVGGTPGLVWQDPLGGMQMFVIPNGTGDFMINHSRKLRITSSSNDVHLECATGYKISVNSWNEFYNRFNGISLQSALNAKQNTISGASGTVYVAGSSGGSPTIPISFSNGIRTS